MYDIKCQKCHSISIIDENVKYHITSIFINEALV